MQIPELPDGEVSVRYWADDTGVYREVTKIERDLEAGSPYGVFTLNTKPFGAELVSEGAWRKFLQEQKRMSDEAEAAFEQAVKDADMRRELKEQLISEELERVGVSADVVAMITKGAKAGGIEVTRGEGSAKAVKVKTNNGRSSEDK